MEGDSAGPVTGPINVDAGVRRSTRHRRMVQSTLFYQKPMTQESVRIKNDGKRCNANDDAIEDEEEDEICGSQHRKKRKKKKGNPNPQSKEPKKIANGNPPSVSTPKKGESDTPMDKKPTPSLMLEAKLKAEEDSRRFSGKQLHPFFTSMKAEKRNEGATRGENSSFVCREICKFDSIGPIHVFEKEQDEEIVIDWKDWNFLDESLPSCSKSGVCDMPSHTAEKTEALIPKNSFSKAVILNKYTRKTSERIIACNVDELQNPEKKLWSEKYHPTKAVDLCGNIDSVKYLNEWLKSWRSSHPTTYINYDNGSDSEDIDNDSTRKNVLLITGPVGSGKSAAIYACAKEQGFKILEMSASDIRSGSVVKQKFGEALESQFLEWSQEEPTEIIDLEAESTQTSKLKPLILFEDVDIVFPEDRGFTVAIKDIADKAKGPVILTSNSSQPSLADNLERSEILFTLPTMKDLLDTLKSVCASEKVEIECSTLETLIHQSRGDIRKAIIQLQFYCLGVHLNKDARFKEPFFCSIESAHRMLPKVIRQSFPSPLSEHIDDELTKCLDSLKEEPLEEPFIEAKKAAMLVLNCPDTEYADSSDFFATESSKKARRTRHVVLSDSDSEPAGLNDDPFAQVGAFQSLDGESRYDDASCVPDSSIVPESEANDGNCSEVEDTFARNDVGSPGSSPEWSPEEVDDSQCVGVGSVGPGFQWLDQCSRVDFGVKRLDDGRAATCPRAKWRSMVGNCGEMKSLSALERKEAAVVVELTSDLSDLISDVGLLPDSVETAAFWEGGLRFYSGNSKLDFDLEGLTSGRDDVVEDDSQGVNKEMLRRVVPLRACMSMKGGALHDYFCCLRCISKVERCRVDERANGLPPRRSRRHYLSSFLSPEEISEVDKCSGLGK